MQRRRFSAGLIILLIGLPVLSQFNTSSPYTRFALGDLTRPGFGQNLAMGGTGVAIHEGNRINYLNPAASAALDSTSVYFDFGANALFSQYAFENQASPEGSNITNNWWNMNLHHVAFASSMGKHLGLSAGIVPYSSIGYNIKQEYNDFPTGTALDTYYNGNGGIMNFFVGASLKLFDRLSLGVNMNYLMGRLTRERSVDFPTHPEYSAISSVEKFDLRKPVFGFGLQYRQDWEKFFLSAGATYDLQTRIDMDRMYEVTNTIYLYDPVPINDSVTITPAYVLGSDTLSNAFDLPAKTGVGFAIGIPDKLTVTADYSRQDWTGSLSGNAYRTTGASSFNLGTEYIPDAEALRGYHKLMSYRLGGYYTNNYLSVLKPLPDGGEGDDFYQLSDYGITFGLGLPVRSLRSSINVAFTMGTRGTTRYNLVKENYGIITFNVTLHDLWFRKRRFD